MEPQMICPHCKGNISPIDIFCPICGKKVNEKPVSTSVATQVLIYSLSLFLAPLGIYPALKYLKQPDPKAKNIGKIALIITIVAVIVVGWITIRVFNSLTGPFAQQINAYKDLGL